MLLFFVSTTFSVSLNNKAISHIFTCVVTLSSVPHSFEWIHSSIWHPFYWYGFLWCFLKRVHWWLSLSAFVCLQRHVFYFAFSYERYLRWVSHSRLTRYVSFFSTIKDTAPLSPHFHSFQQEVCHNPYLCFPVYVLFLWLLLRFLYHWPWEILSHCALAWFSFLFLEIWGVRFIPFITFGNLKVIISSSIYVFLFLLSFGDSNYIHSRPPETVPQLMDTRHLEELLSLLSVCTCSSFYFVSLKFTNLYLCSKLTLLSSIAFCFSSQTLSLLPLEFKCFMSSILYSIFWASGIQSQ